MRKLLATTAMVLVMATGASTLAGATELSVNATFDAQLFTSQTNKLNVLMVEQNIYRGDFQQTARTFTPTSLYDGLGSSLMVSIRSFRG